MLWFWRVMISTVVAAAVGFIAHRILLYLFEGPQSFTVGWLLVITTVATPFLVIAIAFVALSRRAPKRHPTQDDVRCPKCGHILRSRTEARCPECGKEVALPAKE